MYPSGYGNYLSHETGAHGKRNFLIGKQNFLCTVYYPSLSESLFKWTIKYPLVQTTLALMRHFAIASFSGYSAENFPGIT